MDSIVYAALEEICSQGANGLLLRDLWPKLHSLLSSNGLDAGSDVKTAVWNNLLNTPCLQFESPGVSYDSQNPRIQSFEEAEELNLKIVAAEHLRNSFVGVYDIKASDAGISHVQRRVLERLAIARTNGVAQSELAKEFGIKGNNIFYVLRNLECRGLIVRQSTIIRKKEASNNSTVVTTNMLHLHRYAKHLSCQQRLEITKEGKTYVDNENACNGTGDDVSVECPKEDVQVKDYLPAMRAICEKLEKADGKVLVVADIKRDLGYRGIHGHRAWRNICHRLKDIRVVEEFFGKVNQKKEVSCLRLLKKFSSKLFESKTNGGGMEDPDAEQLPKQGKRSHITDQLLELPIEHQIFDMINTEGSKGLTITEVCKRLGLSNKRYYTRLLTMFSRFGMHLEPESLNRGVVYRVWTPGNYIPEASNILSSKLEDASHQNGLGNNASIGLENSLQTIQDEEHWISKDDIFENTGAEVGNPQGSSIVENSLMLLDPSNSQNLSHETSFVSEEELQIVCTRPASDIPSLETPTSTSKPPRRRSYQTYPCLNLNAVSAQREQRILEILQDEKFLLKPELHRQLENLDKEKNTTMDRKTLERSLNKLQQEGHCKCIRVSVPVVTNCGRSRTMDVILHPSVYNVTADLLGQIHERLRSFDMQVRNQGSSSRQKKSELIPVLNSIDRIQRSTRLSVSAETCEAMRANGYVVAKMVRTKLLHIFLWGYSNTLPERDDGLSSRNPHSNCKLLDLDAAIKTMPLELFLQVAGSTKRYENMIEKCRMGLCLSDLPMHEFKSLMDTQATGRISYLVDILRRLKLIRLVSGDLLEAMEVSHASLRHSLELKPYIEEPIATLLPSPGFVALDLRPHIRHDFVLSNRIAVDEYWNTLEYCYATADPKAALHAFPGSAVHEVFLLRSWASARVMTANQRAQLLKRIVNEDRNMKLSYKECAEIAKDLNLTLEQVLRVYSDKRQNRLNRLQGALNAKSSEIQPQKRKRASRKRKISSEENNMNQVKVGTQVESGEKNLTETSDAVQENTDHDNFEHEKHLQSNNNVEHEKHMLSNDNADHDNNDHAEATEELEANSEDDYSSIHECALSRLKPARQKKFSWTEDADKQLLIEYVRHRVILGAKFHRTDWSSLPNLPAPPVTCRRRMALLNRSNPFRKAVMRLCNKLSERYVKYLERFQKISLDDTCGSIIRNYSCQGDFNKNLSDSDSFHNIDELISDDQWDDFDDPNLKMALDEVLRFKQTAKLDAGQGVGFFSELSRTEVNDERKDLVSSATPSKEIQNTKAKRKLSSKRSGRHRVPYIKLISRVKGANGRAYKSLAVSNAAELFKLVFLSTATAPEVPKLLAETLRRYSEHDLFAAFNYLRERKIMVGGSASSPFGLSQAFLQNISSSPFPTNTGRRAVKMTSWIHEREKDFLGEGIDLSADLQCGDVFHLCGLVSSGEVSISPFLPDEGVGEAEDLRKSKRKFENNEISGRDKAKKMKTILGGEGEIISRKEKGFPGIRLSLSRATISRMDALTLFGDKDFVASHLGEDDQGKTFSSLSSGPTSSPPDTVMDGLDSLGTSTSKSALSMESPWEAMALYASHLLSLSLTREEGSLFRPNLFKTVYLAIQKAGDQGLSMEGISQVIDMQGEMIPELIVEVLEAFGRTIKVNTYDSVYVVDHLYRSKYFLMPMAELHQDVEPDLCKGTSNDEALLLHTENNEDNSTSLQKDISMNAEEIHRVTILNHPEQIAQPLSETHSINAIESIKDTKVISPGVDQGNKVTESHFGDSPFCMPILPWINGDGTINEIVYKGLVRRILGIIMQNPGILEANIISQMGVLNPQSCRKLLELMILDNLIIVRKMNQATSAVAPAILGRLLGSSFKKSKLISREHYFANPMSVSSL